jgi:hypothetical protein
MLFEHQIDGAVSSSLTDLHMSVVPPRTWLWQFQNLEKLFIHQPAPHRTATKLIREALNEKIPEPDPVFAKIHIPESMGGPTFDLHVCKDMQLQIDDILMITSYFN